VPVSPAEDVNGVGSRRRSNRIPTVRLVITFMAKRIDNFMLYFIEVTFPCHVEIFLEAAQCHPEFVAGIT
jgi:hypothetical protein